MIALLSLSRILTRRQTLPCCGEQTPVALERVTDERELKQYYHGDDVRRGYLYNTGEECAAYLQFIVDHYDALPPFTFFLQVCRAGPSPKPSAQLESLTTIDQTRRILSNTRLTSLGLCAICVATWTLLVFRTCTW